MLTQNVLRNNASEISHAERALLESAIERTQTYDPGHVVVRQGVKVDISLLLVDGLMSRHIDAPDGRRHLVGLHVPGDFVDLHAYPLEKLDHDVAALTQVRVAVFPHASLEAIQASDNRLTRRLWFLTLLDAAQHRQWIYRLASLNASQRVAHFLCEMNARLLAIAASEGDAFTLPMTQTDIGEACGLTNVHVSRVLRQLRDSNMCSVRGSRVDIIDLKALVAHAFFDPAFLFLNDRTAARAIGAKEGCNDSKPRG
ncbi:Crp/Fnr family transcriptional regulator [Variovorax sp. LT1P1]|uniref:Crp/Fnr family transcriptional regulator n=1 Tax=Variovorax sp. LT1P1 TaxID=3443730 RepID=UPI003F45F026